MFKIIDRNQVKNLAIISGWAFDERIFSQMDLPYNYIFVDEKEINRLKEVKNLSVLGWSQGAYAAADFTIGNSQIVEQLLLVSARPSYPKASIEQIKQMLRKNKQAYLISFYKQCFCSAEKEQFSWFKKNLMNDYLEKFELDDLLAGLDRLSKQKLDFAKLKTIKNLKFIHGEEDKIAPLAELPQDLPLQVLPQTGHLPFLQSNFILSFPPACR